MLLPHAACSMAAHCPLQLCNKRSHRRRRVQSSGAVAARHSAASPMRLAIALFGAPTCQPHTLI